MPESTPPSRIARVLASPHGARVVADLLVVERYQWTTEDDLQRGIQEVLDGHQVYPTREVVLSDGISRIDLLAGGTGIEVKVQGSWANVVRQLTRYAKCPEIVSLVLVTSRAKHHHIPEQLCGKPLHLVSLVGGAI